MLDNDVLSQKYLAPALLLLYGDVERTGEYEKINHRRRIMVLLNYLWSVSAHRPAFRGIAVLEAWLITSCSYWKLKNCVDRR